MAKFFALLWLLMFCEMQAVELQENPLIPMAAVTGRPTREFVRDFMAEYRRVGITQFLIYPRSGCEVEYLSEEWFQLVQNVLDAAEELGFEIAVDESIQAEERPARKPKREETAPEHVIVGRCKSDLSAPSGLQDLIF